MGTPKLRPLAVDGEVTFVTPQSAAETDLARRAFRAQWMYVHGDLDERGLDDFAGMTVDGRSIETRAAVLDDLALDGQFDLTEIYRELI
jgi:hypothetical protein